MSPRFVLDASLTMAWCFADEGGETATAALDSLTDGAAVVPNIWGLEVANVLLVAERRGRLTRAESDEFVALLGALPIDLEPGPTVGVSPAVLALGRQHGLSSYDAAYLELALRSGLPLATSDARLSTVARELGVAFRPGDSD